MTLSLSSPPLIGLGPVSDPPKSDIRGHHVKFEISVEDLEGFKVALQARGMVDNIFHYIFTGSHQE